MAKVKRQEFRIDKRKLVVLDGVLTGSQVDKLLHMLEFSFRSRVGYSGKRNDRRALHMACNANLPGIRDSEVCEKIIELARKEFRAKKLYIDRMYFREFVFGDYAGYHTDTMWGRQVSVVVYLNKKWEPDYHGETLFMDQNGLGVNVLPKCGRVLIFDSLIQHSSSAPSRIYFDSRKIMVFNLAMTRPKKVKSGSKKTAN